MFTEQQLSSLEDYYGENSTPDLVEFLTGMSIKRIKEEQACSMWNNEAIPYPLAEILKFVNHVDYQHMPPEVADARMRKHFPEIRGLEYRKVSTLAKIFVHNQILDIVYEVHTNIIPLVNKIRSERFVI